MDMGTQIGVVTTPPSILSPFRHSKGAVTESRGSSSRNPNPNNAASTYRHPREVTKIPTSYSIRRHNPIKPFSLRLNRDEQPTTLHLTKRGQTKPKPTTSSQKSQFIPPRSLRIESKKRAPPASLNYKFNSNVISLDQSLDDSLSVDTDHLDNSSLHRLLITPRKPKRTLRQALCSRSKDDCLESEDEPPPSTLKEISPGYFEFHRETACLESDDLSSPKKYAAATLIGAKRPGIPAQMKIHSKLFREEIHGEIFKLTPVESGKLASVGVSRLDLLAPESSSCSSSEDDVSAFQGLVESSYLNNAKNNFVRSAFRKGKVSVTPVEPQHRPSIIRLDGDDEDTVIDKKGTGFFDKAISKPSTSSSYQSTTKEIRRCPICDNRLPDTMSAKLTSMLLKARRESFADSDMGFTVKLCKLHRAELLISPHGAQNNYPTTIDWASIPSRVKELMPELIAIIGDKTPSLLLRQALDHFTLHGSRSRDIKNYMERLDKYSCGYYGTKGSHLIFQVLLEMFCKPSSRMKITDRTAKPLKAAEYLDQVLVPETAALLISKDQRCSLDKAREVLSQSRDYGLLKFGEDGDEEKWSEEEENGLRRISVGEEVINLEDDGRRQLSSKKKLIDTFSIIEIGNDFMEVDILIQTTKKSKAVNEDVKDIKGKDGTKVSKESKLPVEIRRKSTVTIDSKDKKLKKDKKRHMKKDIEEDISIVIERPLRQKDIKVTSEVPAQTLKRQKKRKSEDKNSEKALDKQRDNDRRDEGDGATLRRKKKLKREEKDSIRSGKGKLGKAVSYGSDDFVTDEERVVINARRIKLTTN